MKIVLIYDQGQAGAGGKSNPNVGLTAVKGGTGSYTMMQPHFAKIGAQAVYTLYCGTGYFVDNKEEVVTKMTAMVKKINPDYVVCGPCFDFPEYSEMAAMVSASIAKNSEIPSCAMMAPEKNADVIANYKDQTDIVKMPKKGGTGLTDSFVDLCSLVAATVNKTGDLDAVKSKVCY